MPPPRARGSLHRLVGNCVSEDVFLSPVESGRLVESFMSLLAGFFHNPGAQPTTPPRQGSSGSGSTRTKLPCRARKPQRRAAHRGALGISARTGLLEPATVDTKGTTRGGDA
jgi:hypothetical protein